MVKQESSTSSRMLAVDCNNFRNVIDDAISREVLTEQHVAELRDLVDTGGTIDFARLGYAFLYLYHWANYCKARFALRRGGRGIEGNSISVLDLGCGSGASTAAILDWIQYDLKFDGRVSITLVDCCREQLDILHEVAGRSGLLKRADNVRWRCEDVLDSLEAETEEYDMIVDANYLCAESPVRRVSVVEAVAGKLARDGQFVVIERAKSGVFEDIGRCRVITERAMEAIGPLDVPGELIGGWRELGSSPKGEFNIRYSAYSVRRR